MWFIAIQFDGPFVDGFISPGKTPEEAVALTKKKLLGWLKMIQKKKALGTYYKNGSDNRVKSQLRSFQKPWRKTERDGTPVLRVYKVDCPLHTTYWPKELITQKHVVNFMNPVELKRNFEIE